MPVESKMKKVSAFAVFKARKDKGERTPLPKQNSGDRATIRRSTSEPAIKETLGKKSGKSKKLLKALKGGSLRGSLRSAQKLRPTILPNKNETSPHVAENNNGIELTHLRPQESDFKQTADVEPQQTPVHAGMPMTSPGTTGKRKTPVTTPKNSSRTISTPENLENMKETSNLSHNALKLSPVHPPRKSPNISKGKRRLEESNGFPERQRKVKKRREKHLNNDIQSELTMYNSEKDARLCFEKIIHPIKPSKFFKELWEKKPLLVKRHIPTYNDGWFSTAELDKILRKEHLNFTENIDVVSYTNDKRETHNPIGRAHASVVWDYYQNGCSVRLLNPQTYSRNVWKLLSVLQEYFHCCCGANVYLTPPGTQGFAPHFDDIEAFILQLEGKKHWRLYGAKDESGVLPRYSSENFSQNDIGEPILDVILEAGDLLYFPRGVIHQGNTLEGTHSLHMTFSCYQKNSWGDLMEKLIPRALDIALEEDSEFREGIPKDYVNYMGIANSDVRSAERTKFLTKIEELMTKLITFTPVDAACDQMSKQFIIDGLPPVITEAEKSCSIYGAGEHWDADKKQVVSTVEILPDTIIKIIRKHVIRLLSEEDQVRIYHTLENARVYHGNEPQFIDIPAEFAPAVEFLIHAYPQYVTVDSLPLSTLDEKITIASTMYDKGMLITGQPLETVDDNESSCSCSDENCL